MVHALFLDGPPLPILDADNRVTLVVIYSCIVHGRASFLLGLCRGHYSRNEALPFMLASLLAQRGVSTAITRRLLKHSSPQLTNDVYTNVDPALRAAINQLPVADWL